MDDARLLTLFANIPPATLILLEDIDAAMPKKVTPKTDNKFSFQSGPSRFEGMQGGITFSGLLNALDGVIGGDSRIVFMTTNYIDRLDDALIRPGRCDRKEF